jgi:hypothetical protein
MDVLPVLFHPAGGVHLRPATLSANKTAEHTKKISQDFIPSIISENVCRKTIKKRPRIAMR